MVTRDSDRARARDAEKSLDFMSFADHNFTYAHLVYESGNTMGKGTRDRFEECLEMMGHRSFRSSREGSVYVRVRIFFRLESRNNTF